MKKIFFLFAMAAAALSTFSGCDKSSDSVASVSPSVPGKSGSTARFAFSGNTLYVLSDDHIVSFNTDDVRTGLRRIDSSALMANNWSVPTPETIFPYGNYILMGTPSGLLIYQDVDGVLQYVSQYNHIVSCDPVVAQSRYAYATLHQENRCGTGVNQMEVIDLDDITQPRQISVTPMNTPYGLAVNNNDLYVCEANKLCHLDVSNPELPQVLDRYDVVGSDCIYDQGRLVVVGQSGLVQYRVTESGLTELSRIAATRTDP